MVKRYLRKPPTPLTPARLEAQALHYLARYAASSGKLRTILNRKVARATHRLKTAEGGEISPTPDWSAVIEAIINRFTQQQLLQDENFATQKLASLRRQGLSQQRVLQKLQQAGLTKEQIGEALAAEQATTGADDHTTTELTALQRFLLKKRLRPGPDGRLSPRDLAKILRAGFSLATLRSLGVGAFAELPDDLPDDLSETAT